MRRLYFEESHRNPRADKTQTPPMLHHRVLKPKCSTTCEPPEGPRACAVDQAIVYRPAYCPRLAFAVLAIQNEFMKGMAMISPIVTSSMQAKAENTDKGRMFSKRKESATMQTPLKI